MKKSVTKNKKKLKLKRGLVLNTTEKLGNTSYKHFIEMFEADTGLNISKQQFRSVCSTVFLRTLYAINSKLTTIRQLSGGGGSSPDLSDVCDQLEDS